MNRRGFLSGALGFLAAPAIVRASSLMPVVAQPAPLFTSHMGTWEGVRVVSYTEPQHAWLMYGGKISFGDHIFDVGAEPPPECAFAS